MRTPTLAAIASGELAGLKETVGRRRSGAMSNKVHHARHLVSI